MPPKGGFSESGHYIFVLSNVCAFVLTWCLFVGNSRQTTSSVPWHRAPKYERKLNSHLTLKRFLLKWALVSCMRRKEVCATSSETTSLASGGGQKHQNLNLFPGQSAVDSTSINPKTLLSDTRLRVSTGWSNLSVFVVWFCLFASSTNQTRTLPPPSFFFFSISITGPYLPNQHTVLINHDKAD